MTNVFTCLVLKHQFRGSVHKIHSPVLLRFFRSISTFPRFIKSFKHISNYFLIVTPLPKLLDVFFLVFFIGILLFNLCKSYTACCPAYFREQYFLIRIQFLHASVPFFVFPKSTFNRIAAPERI